MRRPRRRVEIVADLVCVHGYLGFTRFLRAARRYRDGGGEVVTVFRPYQLRPDASAAGEPLFEEHKRDRGEAFARAVAADTSIGAADGLELNFGRAVFTNTFDAHLLLSRASAQGKGERMAERLFRAYFTDGLHIADAETLRRLAGEVGVAMGDPGDPGALGDERGRERLRAELDRVRRLGLPSVPAFRFEDGPVLVGEDAASEERFHAALEG
ncbi:dithiol-disulfide isomerase [Streptomyces inhibens]|uniref:Dithiol-disulfide isomerase n=1 Tax=Streptomyces inhibens TaxID=2293571 RepID=A0A371Q2H4_STRIH|nr:DsbA family protein [Streptomyces inhibens]REK88945.1 dithiol-disulfide isomerase [Streptomyces inhibens]